MKRLRAFAVACAVLALTSAASIAETGPRSGRQPRVVSRPAAAGKTQAAQRVPASVSAAGYSVQLNIVTRVVGLSFYRTAVDITNNTATDGVSATFQYCYTSNGLFQGCTTATPLILLKYDSFHTDDIVDYLGTQGLVPADAANSSFGTFIVSFDGLPSNNGWEGTLTGRTYSPIDTANPTNGTVAIAYPGSLFFESARGTLVGIVRDTGPLGPSQAGQLRTNLGITNTGLDGLAASDVTVQLSFYDVTEGSATNGQRVGNVLTTPSLKPGQVYQFNNVFSAAAVPSGVLSCIVFADVLTPTDGTGTIEGYIDLLDGNTQDGAFFEMKCSVGCPNF